MSRANHRQKTFKPRLEVLEDRWCPSAHLFQDAASAMLPGDGGRAVTNSDDGSLVGRAVGHADQPYTDQPYISGPRSPNDSRLVGRIISDPDESRLVGRAIGDPDQSRLLGRAVTNSDDGSLVGRTIGDPDDEFAHPAMTHLNVRGTGMARLTNAQPPAPQIQGTVDGPLASSFDVFVSAMRQTESGVIFIESSHVFRTAQGDSLTTMDHIVLTPTDQKGLYRLNNHMRIVEGTGRFQGATGQIETHGFVNFVTGEITFRYHAEILFPVFAR